MYTSVKLICIDANEGITPWADSCFHYHFQIGVLLSLKADGILTESQYRTAELVLRKQMQKER